jgi:ubiquinone/menaquinone biosynthesis C-methylase UbiE
MNLEHYRQSANEQLRVAKLMGLIPHKGANALDAGARDGFLSVKLADYFDTVTAIDLELPNIAHERVRPQIGDMTQLEFKDNAFDLVLCAEVLEHIPTALLAKACHELSRVAKEYLIIGVPYNQDLRMARTTCYSCHQTNPPWGHVNKFDAALLKNLFQDMEIEKTEYIGTSTARTNALSTLLMDWAGNPYGTYSQDEACVHCNKKLQLPPERNLMQKVFTKLAIYINNIQQLCVGEQANWIHILFKKPAP